VVERHASVRRLCEQRQQAGHASDQNENPTGKIDHDLSLTVGGVASLSSLPTGIAAALQRLQ
jgi:hypothetical protein